MAAVGFEGTLFAGAYRVDLFSQIFKAMVSLGLFLIICISGDRMGVKNPCRAEFYLLLFSSTLALMMLVSAAHLLSIYMSLELSSYSLYLLVVLRKDEKVAIEAGLKYFLIGVIASAVTLFGFALLYGTIQAAYLDDIMRVLPQFADRPLVMMGLVLALAGFFFKLAVFPFHFWIADVYQGATNPVAGYIATASKVGAVGILLRVVSINAESSTYLVHVLGALAVVSMTVGNLTAIAQNDLKRLLAYSSVAHAGYVLIGILSMTPSGYAAAIFYAMGVLMMKFTGFLVVVRVAADGINPKIADLAGLHRRCPILAAALFLCMFSLAGIPPTIGFTGKFLIFRAAIEKGHFMLVLIAMINVAVSLYYYLMVVRAAYLLEPEPNAPGLVLSPGIRWLTGATACAMVVVGIFPTYFIGLFHAAAHFLG
jgi:NADH-quinone oxidoreductase subunit N